MTDREISRYQDLDTRRSWFIKLASTIASVFVGTSIVSGMRSAGAAAGPGDEKVVTLSDRSALTQAHDVDCAYLLGFAVPFDGGGHRVRRIGLLRQPLLAGQFISGTNVWEIEEEQPTLKMYGAGFGSIDDRQAIQTAIDHLARRGGGILRADAVTTYNLGITLYKRSDGSTYGACSIMCRDNVHIDGPRSAIFRLKDKELGPGAFYRMFASDDVTGLSNVELKGFTIDGNREMQTPGVQCLNILLDCKQNIDVRNIHCKNANGTGMMLRGRVGAICTNIRVLDCFVENCSNIGIQVSHFENLEIRGNRVDLTKDNSIDIYGDDGSTVPDSGNFSISGNNLSRGNVGIFLETVRDGRVFDNKILATAQSGWMINRIHGAPSGILIYGNTIRDCPRGGWFSGDMKPTVAAFRNDIAGFTEVGIEFGTGPSVSYIHISDNYFIPATKTTPIFRTNNWTQPNTAAFIKGERNAILLNDYDASAAIQRRATRHIGVVFRDWVGLVGEAGPDYGRQVSGMIVTIPCDGDGPRTLIISTKLEGSGMSIWTLFWTRFEGRLILEPQPRKVIKGDDPIRSLTADDDKILVNFRDQRTQCEWSNKNVLTS